MSKPTGSRWIAIPIAVYFLYFARGALRARFAIDDPMNLAFYWQRGLLRSMADVVAFWDNAYRPMAAAFYMPIYDFFGMNPLPYRVAVLAILAVNIYLSYRIALRVSGSGAAAALTAMLVCAHAAMSPVYYNTSQIYDVLAFFFTALMLAVYLRARAQGGPTLAQSAIVVAAFLAAMNSKEIAVVGAVWVLAYELVIEHKGEGKRKLGVSAILVALAIAFTATRALGPHSLSTQPGYRLDFSAHRFIINAKMYLNDLFYTSWFNKNWKVIVVWTLGTALCAIARRRVLWWAWILVSTAALPVIFTVEPRNGPSLYLPLLAVALWISVAATIFFRPWPIREWSAAALAALLLVPGTIRYWDGGTGLVLRDQQRTWSVLSQIRELSPRPAPGSTILFLNNPFADWDIWFISMLVWNDHTLNPKLANKLDAPPDPAAFDWVFAFDGDRLRVVRAPAR